MIMREEIKNLLEKSIKLLQKEEVLSGFEIPEVRIEHPEEKAHGDYATNVAMVIAKIVKKDPMEIANILSEKLKLHTPPPPSRPSGRPLVKSEKLFEKIEVAAPGFINFFLSATFFIDELERILKEKDRYGSSKIGKGKTVVVDYSSPNIAKPFGIGHLRSTINGQALYNIYKFLYWKCI